MRTSKTTIHLAVGDALRSVAFYEALFSAHPSELTPTTALFDLESPPLRLTVELEKGKIASRSFTLVVNEPGHVGEACIALRRAGVRLLLHDEGLEARDPDRNTWRVRFVPSANGRRVEAP
jgi:hypothetical protein